MTRGTHGNKPRKKAREFSRPPGVTGTLVLTLEYEDGVTITHGGETCRVTVYRKDGRLKLAVSAPRSFGIVRDTANPLPSEGGPKAA